MAAAFNLPMISYFCTNYETSNKKDFPTFARTRPPDTQIAKSVVSLLLAYNWTQVAFFHVDHDSSEIAPIAKTVINTLALAGIRINAVRTWSEDYYHGYRANPFDDMVRETFRDTRSKLRNKCLRKKMINPSNEAFSFTLLLTQFKKFSFRFEPNV